MRNTANKVDGAAPLTTGILSAAEDTARFNELRNAVSTAGIALDPDQGPDTDVQMLAQAIARYASGGVVYRDGSAVANSYSVTPFNSFIAPRAYFDGMLIKFRPNVSNTSASTVNVNGLGNQLIRTPAGVDLSAGDLTAGVLHEATYDAGNGWFVIAGGTTSGGVITPPSDVTDVIVTGPNGVTQDVVENYIASGFTSTVAGEILDFYTWTRPDGSTFTGDTLSYAHPTTGVFTLSVIATGDQGSTSAPVSHVVTSSEATGVVLI